MKSLSIKSIIVVFTILLMLIPNLRAEKLIGEYSENSSSIYYSKNFPATANTEKVIWPAVALGVVGAAIFALGVIDGWNSVKASLEESNAFNNYNANDFSSYDN